MADDVADGEHMEKNPALTCQSAEYHSWRLIGTVEWTHTPVEVSPGPSQDSLWSDKKKSRMAVSLGCNS